MGSVSNEARRWWHYTLGRTVIMVAADERIKRARKGLDKGERAAVWFSCRPTWEPTATKSFASATGVREATLAEMVEVGGPLARVEVTEAVARHTWAHHRRIGGVDPRVLDGLESSARREGADPADWRVSYHEVPIREILCVEASEDGIAWVPVGVVADDGRSLRLAPDFVERVTVALRKHPPDAATKARR